MLPAGAAVQPYDWEAPRPLAKPALDAARRVMASWPRSVQSQLGPLLKCFVQCELAKLEQELYGATIAQMPSPTVLALLTAPVRGLLQCDLELAFQMIDRTLGGDGRPGVPLRELTDLETPTMLYLLQEWADLMGRIWHDPQAPAHWVLGASLESRPEYLTLAAEGDWVLVARYRLQIADTVGTVSWLWPLTDVSPLADRAAAGLGAEEGVPTAGDVSLPLGALPVRVAVRLGAVPLTPAEWAALREGAVVRLPTYVGDALTATVEGRPKGWVQVGRYRQRYTIRWLSSPGRTEGVGAEGVGE